MPRAEGARRRRHVVPVLAVCLWLPRQLSAGVPPAAQQAEAGAPVPLFLELVVNGRSSGEVVEVTQRGPHYEVDAAILRRLYVLRQAAAAQRVAVDSLPGVSTEYDSLGQRLLLSVPPEWLPEQSLPGSGLRRRVQAVAGTGLLLNYDLYSTQSQGVSMNSAWTEARYFSPTGVFSHTGILRRGGWSGPAYLRYDSRWTTPDTEGAAERSIGDVVLGALPWSSAVRLGGVQWSRNFGLRPDLVSYPLPQFAGQAAVPSAVDLFVNGYRTASRNIDPGPFVFNELPYVSGAGAATVVTTDALGRQVSTNLPFYVSTTLLRPGLTDYSVSIGALRRNYGLRSFDYGAPLAAGVVRRGWSDKLTLEAQGQAGRGLSVAGLGAVLQPGYFGTLAASLSRGSTPTTGSGWQTSMGYQYNTQSGGVSLQQINRQAGYGDAASYANDGYRLYRRQRQISANMTLGVGAISAGMVDLRGGGSTLSPDNARSRVVYASYTRPISNTAFLSVSAGRTIETGETQVRLQLTYTLGRNASANLAAVKSGDQQRLQAQYQQDIPSDGGFGWNISHSLAEQHNGDYTQAALQYRDRRMLLQGGVYGSGGQVSRWAGASGSLGYLDGRAFATNRVTDAFALVSTGREGVPVRYDQQLIGTTDRDGYLLVPQVPGYLEGQYAIEMLDLPPDVQVQTPQRGMAVRGGTGAVMELPVRTVESATLFLVGVDGAPLRAGTPLRHVEANLDTVVGWDGVVFLPELLPFNTLLMRTGSGPCHVRFEAAQYRQGRRELQCSAGEPPP
ncbi:fimbria/pilus outer membrane usher protein [Xylophilus rhododendri]|uniref:Fimbria/pilus outer membrane usher protein n=1 Tax=Xylophilus rhododendri TaxID=2697032 RepID=A0A857J5K0_9BURK|nr:fimbria/pilus outer membrane usher protein [Xylophilus rhododendri]QHI98977.1 fimbria/pilus outer membrane usher protein [Xylophilus rhododendri]